jgi:hypothetical protein
VLFRSYVDPRTTVNRYVGTIVYSPVAGEHCDIEDLADCPSIFLDVNGECSGDENKTTLNVILRGAKCSKTFPVIRASMKPLALYSLVGCDIKIPELPPYTNNVIIANRLNVDGGGSLPNCTIQGGSFYSGLGADAIVYVGSVTSLYDVTFQGVGLGLQHGRSASVQNCQVFDTTSSHGGIFGYDMSMIMIIGTLSGRNNVYGMSIRPTAKVSYQVATKPTLTGNSGDVNVEGVGVFSWSDMPRSWNSCSGTATLVNGAATVPLKNMATDAVFMFCRNSDGSNPTGELRASTADLSGLGTAAAQQIVRSSNDDANFGDNGTVSWSCVSQSTGNGGIFAY